eukprot:CAMPEP_0197189184 /NCGR_PEP_ID=MMETSP1423-20130617/19300_1 /TAXON_ID=476441 /ORGANISM="Pseudo-nitzschia heimii, Strain UNC1101" /LENGTH=479 /DNA_ID=CAMNT_0042641233 /DNA_START=410 /DNA_END=1846 /DNA_ORIENTATION=+
MTAVEEVDKGWRRYGKMFRANIVLADESNGGNIFALSDSCSIERYYRVADRVLEQFLSSNIAERNELIECYLIGNRLFKFLSVVLPTHHQYFSTNPKHEELRNGSESQLMELLQYMEELELMIDEMEYNRYILKDLTPIMNENEVAQEVGIVEGMFSERNRIENSNKDFTAVTKPEVPTELNVERSESQVENVSQQNATNNFNQRNDEYRRLRDGKVKEAVHAIEASHRIQKYNSRDQNQILKQRIAAVVTASSNGGIYVNKSRSVRSTSSRNAALSSSCSPNTRKHLLGSFPGKSRSQFQESLRGKDSSVDSQKLFQDKQLSTEQLIRRNETQPFCDLPGDSLSWDVDFSEFNVFSTGRVQDFYSPELKTKNTNIDLIMHDQCSREQKQSEKPKTLPKIKNPPMSHPRSTWGHSQFRTARSLPSFEEHDFEMTVSSGLSDCSSDVFLSLENPGLEMNPIKTKIEQRLERAMGSRKNPW